MGSGSSVEYYQYMQQQQQQQQGQPQQQQQYDHHPLSDSTSGYPPRAGSLFDGSVLGQSGRGGGTPMTRPGTAGGNNSAPPPDSAAALLRQHLLNAGQLLWKSAPDMLQRMEVLEGHNSALAREVAELRSILSKDDLFATLEQVRAENEQLRQRVGELELEAATGRGYASMGCVRESAVLCGVAPRGMAPRFAAAGVGVLHVHGSWIDLLPLNGFSESLA
jgi:hypothetical protein